MTGISSLEICAGGGGQALGFPSQIETWRAMRSTGPGLRNWVGTFSRFGSANSERTVAPRPASSSSLTVHSRSRRKSRPPGRSGRSSCGAPFPLGHGPRGRLIRLALTWHRGTGLFTNESNNSTFGGGST